MVARICQLYPMANGATIVSKFFSLMYKWTWPRPVMLKHIEEGDLGLRVWNPQVYGGDRAHLHVGTEDQQLVVAAAQHAEEGCGVIFPANLFRFGRAAGRDARHRQVVSRRESSRQR